MDWGLPHSFHGSALAGKLSCTSHCGRSLSIREMCKSQHLDKKKVYNLVGKRSCREINQVAKGPGERWDSRTECQTSSSEFNSFLCTNRRHAQMWCLRALCLLEEHGHHLVTLTSLGNPSNHGPAFSKSDLWPHPYSWERQLQREPVWNLSQPPWR